MADLEALARRLYEHGTRSAPTWDQLGEVTKGEWRTMAQRHAAGDTEWWSIFPPKQPLAAAPAQPQVELF
jgi:hypothetical protein